MSTPDERIGAAVSMSLREHSDDDVITALAGHFVSLLTEFLRRKGVDTSKMIHIDGGKNRDITLGPVKYPGITDTTHRAETKS